MATNFPNSVDSLTNPTTSDTLATVSHSGQHADANDAIEAIELALLDGAPMYIDDTNERVGIGTASPNAKLDVEGTINQPWGSSITQDGVNNPEFLDVGYTAGVGNHVDLSVPNNNGTAGHGNNVIRVVDTGRVGIGTTSPSYTLHVNGSARTSSLDTSSLLFDNYYHTNQPAGRLYCYASGSVAGWSSGATSNGTRYHMRFSSPSYLGVGGIYTYNGNTYYANYSDYRLKDNVTPLANASNIVANLNPISYTMRHNPETTHLGFLAHELQEHIPSAVGGTKDEVDDEGNPVYQNVDLGKVVPVLTAALQEALTTINDLTARIEALEAG